LCSELVAPAGSLDVTACWFKIAVDQEGGPAALARTPTMPPGLAVHCARALAPHPNRPHQYPEQREACGKTQREINCVGGYHCRQLRESDES
jgi:hypothetical protein